QNVVSTQAAGTVVGQNPPGGTKVPQASTVTLDISSGGTPVPSVIGEPQAEATATLQSDGFKVKPVIAQASAGFAAGTVFQTSPPANATVAQGSTVTIYVAAAVTPTSAPSSTSPAPALIAVVGSAPGYVTAGRG